ncbi:MAG: hypothetical protein IT356_12550 [Gemmatimonadaceae bacterium]|nr:hypothetical protein [Gemmatimonadaceae bacterium]
MTSVELEARAIAQLGGGPYLLTEILPGILGGGGRRFHPIGELAPGYCCLRRWPGPEGGHLYAKGESWDDVAAQLGITDP